MDNPLTYAIESTAINRADLARKLGVSRQYISKAEKGCYVNLNASILCWIQGVTEKHFPDGVSRTTINNWYKVWVRTKRFETLGKLGCEFPRFVKSRNDVSHIVMPLQVRGDEHTGQPPVANLIVPKTDREAFILWRKTYWETSYGFATQMCVNPASVDNYEAGKVGAMPEDLRIFFNWLAGALNGN